MFVSESILCASSKAKFARQRGMSYLNAIKYPLFLSLQTSKFFKTHLEGNRGLPGKKKKKKEEKKDGKHNRLTKNNL